MSIPAAQNILRRLRSNNIKVWLVPRGAGQPAEVHFSSLDTVSPALKAQITEHGLFIRKKLEEEQITREARASLKRRTDKSRKDKLPDAPAEEL